MVTVSFIEAIRRALDEEMTRDPRVYLFGEDVAVGGPFGATKGLAQRHGSSRVRNTPISEATITGMGVGAALCGIRPVIEIMFMDFITLALDALVNQAAKYRQMSGGQLSVPLVVRTQAGAAGGAAAQHSQSLEAWLVHVPGLVVVAPSSPAEAYGLLKNAIRLDDPVVFIEHKRLYAEKELLSESESIIQIGQANIVREGTDATLITYSNMLRPVLEVVDQRAPKGESIEVIDLRTLVPLDMATILSSVAKTHRLVVVHEAVRSGGVGAEVAARVASDAFDYLDSQIIRVGCSFAPIPFSPGLEQALLPGQKEINAALDEVLL
jgi:acetoin:2,6-dichlorophenolindophenol oxidoreductase subunit beta